VESREASPSAYAGITPDSLFLVSGGARGVTARCVIALAERRRCRFILLGRSPRLGIEPAWAAGCADETVLKRRIAVDLREREERVTPAAIQRAYDGLTSSREIERTLAGVRRAGGDATYVRVDVGDLSALRRALAEVMEGEDAISGLIHGAGALSDKLIERKTGEDFDRVYDTKMLGLENLLQCVQSDRLRHLVLFSSAAGFFGNPGQTDYAMANEALNRVGTLFKRAHPACRTLALNWGPWDGGMVTPELRLLFRERGVRVIDADGGARAFVELLERESDEVQVLVGDGLGPAPVRPALGPRRQRIRRRLTLEANPFLRDHIVGGHAVLPSVCAAAWMANACEQLYPGFRFFGMDDLRILKGIVFDESLQPEVALELEETAREGDETVRLRGTVTSVTLAGQVRYHYSASVTLLRGLPDAPFYMGMDVRADMHARDGGDLYADGTLFHGPSFRGVQRVVNASVERLTLRCALPPLSDADQGQFPVQAFNLYVADAQFQSLLVWVRLFRGAASLPVGAARSEHYLPLRFGETYYVSLEVASCSDHELTGTTTVHDAKGKIYARVTGARVTFSEQLNAQFVPAMRPIAGPAPCAASQALA